jgi:hypothetical protein
MRAHQINPDVAFQRAGMQCVRVANSEYSSDVVHPIMQSDDPASDPHLVKINLEGTCKQLFAEKDTFSCSSDGLIIQRGNRTECPFDESNCSKTTTFAQMDYLLNPVVGNGNISDYGHPDCTGPGSPHCDPYNLAIVLYQTRCECEMFVDLMASVSVNILRAETEWHYPELGQRSVRLFFFVFVFCFFTQRLLPLLCFVACHIISPLSVSCVHSLIATVPLLGTIFVFKQYYCKNANLATQVLVSA